SEADPIVTRCRHVPPAVADVVDRCLQKSPARRFASAGDIVSALHDRPVDKPRPSRFLTVWRVHQIATMVLYVATAWAAWWIKEFFKPSPMLLAVFVALGIGAAAAGVMRGHLVFT